MSPTGIRSPTRTAKSLATAGILTKGSNRYSGSSWHRSGSNSTAATGQPCSPNLPAISGCNSPTQPASSSPSSTIAERPGCRYGPASRAHGAGEHDADPADLTHAHEPAGVLRIELARHAEPQRGLSQVVLRDVCEEHAPQLEKRRASRPEGPVTGRGVEQPRQHTGSQKAAFGAKGVLQPDGPVIQAEVIRPALGAERVGNSLRESEIREQTPEHTRLSLRHSKRPGLGNGGQPLWHSVEPDEPSDLLDEICLAAKIPPEGGNGSPQPSVLPLDLAPQGL